MYEAQTSSLVQSVNECYELKAQIKSLQDQLATAVQQLNLFNSGHKSVEVNFIRFFFPFAVCLNWFSIIILNFSSFLLVSFMRFVSGE